MNKTTETLVRINEGINRSMLCDGSLRVKVALSLIPKEVKTVLDVGCNSGEITNIIHEHGLDVTGIDLVKNHIEHCKKTYPEITFINEEVEKVKSKYDMIFLGEIIEHVIDPVEFLKSCKEKLNKNGVIIITTPNVVSLKKRVKSILGIYPEPNGDWDFNHLHLYTRKNLKRICERAGFTVEVATSTKSTLFWRVQIPCPFDTLANRIIFRIKRI